ncbi:hypothetical protein BDA99DRAFT_536124 [Phascolomyces articulosus]|uniref:Uncharacterized protein n=1 Tax=Phascolomyces articulosus TaxID=60185 RepID=A0AAD5K2Q9_9FUNG|nr:hypothetical protein BDA99DRAFT_536124 [Phascolomyces articulosus]
MVKIKEWKKNIRSDTTIQPEIIQALRYTEHKISNPLTTKTHVNPSLYDTKRDMVLYIINFLCTAYQNKLMMAAYYDIFWDTFSKPISVAEYGPNVPVLLHVPCTMENPEPIVVIKRETTHAGQPPVVLITGVFIKHKRPIIMDERRDQSKGLMVFDRRSTTAVSKEFSSPGFYPLDVTHGPLMSLLAAVRLLDPVDSQSNNTNNTGGLIQPPTTAAAGMINNNNNNTNNQQNLSYPMMFPPQNNMYYGMSVRPGLPPIPPPNIAAAAAANLPPQLLPVLQPYLFGQQQQQLPPPQQQQQNFIIQQQQQPKSSPYQPNSYTQRKPIKQLPKQNTMVSAPPSSSSSSSSSSSQFPNMDMLNISSARSSPAYLVNSNSNHLYSGVSPAPSTDGPTELRNISKSPSQHRIRRKQPPNVNPIPIPESSNNPSSNKKNNSKATRRVRFAKTDQVFSYDVDEEEYYSDYSQHEDDYYEDDDVDEDDDAEDEYYNDEEEEEDMQMIRRRWSPRMMAREQSHDVYNFQSRAPAHFPYRRKGRRRWPAVVHRPPLHLHHTEV